MTKTTRAEKTARVFRRLTELLVEEDLREEDVLCLREHCSSRTLTAVKAE